jgi:hypothetical protein
LDHGLENVVRMEDYWIMKSTLLLFMFALMVANSPSTASGQTISRTPPPPPLAKRSTVKAKGNKAIPPAPPSALSKSELKKRNSWSSKASRYQTPGREVTGRRDMSGKPTGFYPVTRGVDIPNPSAQLSASKRKR